MKAEKTRNKKTEAKLVFVLARLEDERVGRRCAKGYMNRSDDDDDDDEEERGRGRERARKKNGTNTWL